MLRLPETVIPMSRRKTVLRLAPLWIMIFPIFCFMLIMCYYGYSKGEEISGFIFPTLILGAFLFGITALVKITHQPIILSYDGIKIIKGKKTRFLAWSEISHIKASSHKGAHLIELHLSDWHNRVKKLQGKEKLAIILKEQFLVKSYVGVSSAYLNVSHKDLTDLVETYFEKSRVRP